MLELSPNCCPPPAAFLLEAPPVLISGMLRGPPCLFSFPSWFFSLLFYFKISFPFGHVGHESWSQRMNHLLNYFALKSGSSGAWRRPGDGTMGQIQWKGAASVKTSGVLTKRVVRDVGKGRGVSRGSGISLPALRVYGCWSLSSV